MSSFNEEIYQVTAIKYFPSGVEFKIGERVQIGKSVHHGAIKYFFVLEYNGVTSIRAAIHDEHTGNGLTTNISELTHLADKNI